MFNITAKDGKARTGILKIGKKEIKTPFFMPVSTKGAVKFADFEELKEIGTDCVISNSLLLYQRPGLEVIKKAGGLHKFYNWPKGIFTDSGGFQTLDEFFKKKSTDEGAYFKSPYDGTTELITPEKAMEIQMTLKCDVAMCLDDVPKHDDPTDIIKEKTRKTHLWAERCKKAHKGPQLLFGIAQGGMNKDIRKKSIEFISKLDFDGIALGGLAIGEPIVTMHEMIRASINHAPEDKPKYLMGVGSPNDLLECISMGVDIFDSTFPTQNARHSTLFTWRGKLKLDRKEYRTDQGPIDKDCDCRVCKNYSRAYIHHLLRVSEPTGKKLATYHNLFFMQKLIEKTRDSISEGKFDEFRTEFSRVYM